MYTLKLGYTRKRNQERSTLFGFILPQQFPPDVDLNSYYSFRRVLNSNPRLFIKSQPKKTIAEGNVRKKNSEFMIRMHNIGASSGKNNCHSYL